MPSFLIRIQAILTFVFLFKCVFFSISQVTIDFQFEADGGSKGLNGGFEICNNTGAVLPNGFSIDFRWPCFKGFSWGPNSTRNGAGSCDTWTFTFEPYQLPGPGQCKTVSSGNSTGAYDPPLRFPAYGIDMNGDTVWVETSDPSYIPKSYNAGNWEYTFDKDCFIPSPDEICLGEAQIREWNEVSDIRVPVNRKGWAIAAVHVATLFNNMVGADLYSVNYTFAQSIIEGRMGCDQNFMPPSGDDNPLNYKGASGASGCFQILPPGWAQIQQYFPSLTSGLNYSDIISGDNFITAALSKVLYDITTFTKYEKISCADPIGFFNESVDPYAIETIIAYAYHEGPYGSESVLNDILINNRDVLKNNPNIADYISLNFSTSSVMYAERIRNNLIQLENNFNVPGGHSARTNEAQTNWLGGTPPDDYEYHGCYDELISWTDFEVYIDEASKLFWTSDISDVKAKTKAAFDLINSGGPVNFSQIGEIVDAMTLSFPAYSADEGLGNNFFASSCGSPKVTMSSCDKICPGDQGELWIHLMGEPPFSYTVQGPSGQLYSNYNVMRATDVVKVDEPGTFKVVHIQDANTDVFLNCHNASTVIENAGDASVKWNKDNTDDNKCTSGNLTFDLSGSGPWEIIYTKNRIEDHSITVPVGASTPYVVNSEQTLGGDEFILKKMVAGGCDSDLNDTIKFCSECIKPQIDILTIDTSICQGDTALIRLELDGSSNYSLYYNIDEVSLSITNISSDYLEIPVWIGGTLTIDSLRDANCLNDTVTNNLTITLNPPPSLDLGSDSSVCVGPVVLDAGSSGATKYLWKGNSDDPTYSADTTGNYWVIATKNACSDTDSINITIGGKLPVFLGNDTSLCDKDTLTLSVGDYNTINWKDTINNTGIDKSFEVTKGTRVYVYIKDTEGCEGHDTIDVVFKPTPVVSLSLKDTVTICQTSGDYTFDAGNVGSDYLWSTGDNTQTITKGKNDEGDYWVKVTTNGCSDSDSVYLKVDTKLSVYLGGDTIGVCPGTDTLLDAGYGLGYTFDWNDGNGPILDSTFRSGGGKEVKVIVSDAGGCTGKDSTFIKEINPLVINIGNDTSLCFGSPSLSFSMVSGRQDVTVKSWHDGTTTDYSFPSDSTHWYWLEVDSSGCVYRDSLYFERDTLPVVKLGVDTFICSGASDTIKLSVGTFSNYKWSKILNSGDSLIGTSSAYDIGDPGSYSLHVTDGNKCKNGDTVNVSSQPGTVFTLLKDTTICPKGSVTIDVPSQLQGVLNTSWKWSKDGSGVSSFYKVENRNHLDTLDIVLEYTNEFACVTRDTTRVIVNNNLPILLRDTSVCIGDYIEFSSGYPDNSSYIYNWKEGSSTLSSKNNYVIDSALVGDAGTINIEVENITEGCSGDTSIALVVNVLPDPELSSGAVCFGESVVLDHGLTNVMSVWDHGESTNPITVQDSGIYRVSVTDDNDCIGEDSVRVIMYDNPISELEDEIIVCFDDMDSRLSLDPGSYDLYTYEWIYGSSSQVISTSQVASADQKGVYTVTLTNLANCSTRDSIYVKEDCPAHVWLPNSFTPNDNTVNDVWKIVGRGIETVEVVVYNRWGELVWMGNAMNDFWDGTHYVTNQDVQQDVYVYRLKYTYLNVEGGLELKQRMGRIALIR